MPKFSCTSTVADARPTNAQYQQVLEGSHSDVEALLIRLKNFVSSAFVDGLDATTAVRGFGDGHPPGCLDCSMAGTDKVVSSLVVLES